MDKRAFLYYFGRLLIPYDLQCFGEDIWYFQNSFKLIQNMF